MAMNYDDFTRKYYGDWQVNERDLAIDEKLDEYYRTTDKLHNVEAAAHNRKLLEWLKMNGYSQDDISQAKRRASSRR